MMKLFAVIEQVNQKVVGCTLHPTVEAAEAHATVLATENATLSQDECREMLAVSDGIEQGDWSVQIQATTEPKAAQ